MFTHFFINRPIAASTISVVIVVLGLVTLKMLPIAQYPEVAPPTIQVSAIYPGANAKVVAETVATPIEQEVNGVENMLYMFSKCTNDGQMYLDVTFALGADLNMAQVLVQNRVAIAEAKLPEDVKRQGVTTKKKSPSILLCINLISQKKKDSNGKDIIDSKTGYPEYKKDQLYLSNYATIQIKDALARISGVGDVTFIGPRDYSMRVWLDPNKLSYRGLSATEVVQSLKEQNVQVAAGRIGQPPVSKGIATQLTINTQGRLTDEKQFGKIIVKTADGRVTYLKDLVKDEEGIELGAKNYDVNSYLDGEPSVTLAVFQLPGSNAIKTAETIKAEMRKLKERFPDGVDYKIVYDTTVFVEESISAVYHTLIEAFVLVFIVVLVFLQNWRATIVPMVAVPVALVGTFIVMAGLGFSLNNLSLFGLVLAIGIVVDDAIVVVENVERFLAMGYSPKEAAHKAMDEVTGAIIAISLVLSAVFVPTALLAGISGQFFRQFALTIAASTIFSALNSLTLSPALCALLLKPHPHAQTGDGHVEGQHHVTQEALPRLGIVVIGALIANHFLAPLVGPWFGLEVGHGHGDSEHPVNPVHAWALRLGMYAVGAVAGWFLSALINKGLGKVFQGFNWTFDRTINGYGRVVSLLLRVSVIVIAVYGGLLGLTYLSFKAVPAGFIPEQDKGYLVVNAQLPEGAALERTEEVVNKLTEISLKTEGVAHTIGMPGYSALLGTNISNVGGMYVILAPFEERAGHPELSAKEVMLKLRQKFKDVIDAKVVVFGAPPVDGLGSTGGFKMQTQDRGGTGNFLVLQGAVENLVTKGNQQPGLVGLFSSFRADQPQLYVDINRDQVKALDVSLTDLFNTLQIYLGSSYVNDVTLFGRNWQVNVQADSKFRMDPDDIGRLMVPNRSGDMVPLAAMIDVHFTTGPAIVNHYNMYTSAEVSGNPAPGTSSGQAITLMESLAKQELPSNMGYAWTELTFQQILASLDPLSPFIFPLCVLLVFLILAFQYESWSLPMSILLIVPMCIMCAMIGLLLNGLDNNIFTQIGLVVLIGLAAKNAILIVEFAKQKEDAGEPRFQATVDACRLRLRPILMTSFAFILGVVPLVLAVGAGAEMRQALGIAVFSGMLGVTIFGIFLTPVFYLVIRWLTARQAAAPADRPTAAAAAAGQPADTKVVGRDGHAAPDRPQQPVP
jgi:multidrug efflux pump